jgi:pSer/pThr/pTyr-binding forkhead associated (FHA) protein
MGQVIDPPSGQFSAAVIEGPDLGLAFPLVDKALCIGKGSDCDIMLTDSAVSKQHLELRLDRGAIRVRDLGSTNGTFIGAKRVVDSVVRCGTIVKIGRTRLELRGQTPAPLLSREGAASGVQQPTRPQIDFGLPYKEARERVLNDFERTYLEAALTRNAGNLSRTAREIGLTRHYLRKLLREHALISPRPPGRPPRS